MDGGDHHQQQLQASRVVPGLLSGDFVLPENLEKCWTDYTECNEEKFFRKFVSGFVNSWHLQVCPNWELLVTSYLQHGRHSEKTVQRLPDELLPAITKFLFVAKDEVEQGRVNVKNVLQMREIVQSLIIICRNPDHIPLVASMEIVRQLTQLSTLLLQHLLEMESTFFVAKVRTEVSSQNLRTEIMAFISQACHFLETLYDPFFRWRAFVCGKNEQRSPGSGVRFPDESTPTMLHPETIPFLYESFETALVDSFPQLGLEMLNIFGAVLSGSRRNALKAISPATTKMLLKTVRDANTSSDLHISAIYCSAKSIQVLNDAPIHERQLDVTILVQQYQQILRSLKEKAGLATLVEGVGMLTRILQVKNDQDLKKILAKNEIIDTLMEVLENCNLDPDSKRTLLPVVVNRISLLLSDCDISCEQMSRKRGYDRLFGIINGVGPPDMNTLQSVLSMSTFGDEESRLLRNAKPIEYLLKWICETDYENEDQQVWLTECLRRLCCANIHNKMLCCESDIPLQIIETLKSFDRLHERSIGELFELLQCLCSHSITTLELKKLLSLLQDDESVDGEKDRISFPFKNQVIDAINVMAKGSGRQVCRQYFDFRPKTDEGLSVPNIRQWTGPIHGFAFHCWLRLDRTGDGSSPRKLKPGHVSSNENSPVSIGDTRRQLYSIYSAAGNGFEAFITEDGTLTVATASKKEFLAVPLLAAADGCPPVNDGLWHCVQISHSTGKRPFGSSHLQVHVDGVKRVECALKYPASTNDTWAYCQIGSPLRRTAVPALNLDSKSASKPQRIKEGIMDAIKIGVPGVLNLPQSLRHGSNDPHIRWTLIGLEDQLWGRPTSIGGQIGMIYLFQDSLGPSLVKFLHDLGPNQGLSFASEESPEMSELLSKLVFSYSAGSCRNMICPNLNSALPQFEGHVMAVPYSTQDIKDVINCVGGVQALIPLLERAFQSRQSFFVSGFLSIVQNFIRCHQINCEQLLRGGGVFIIGGLLQNLHPTLVDLNVLKAAQVLSEMAQDSNDQKLLLQIYNGILFDFRVWCKSEFCVQIGHVQYLSTLIKDNRKFFRKKFGTQFLLDVIRVHYGSCPALSKDDSKTIRGALFGLVKFYLQKDVSSKDVLPIVNFILSVKQEELLLELIDLVIKYLESRHAKDQMFLIMFEAKRADLFCCLLTENTFSENLRHELIKLILILMRTHKVSARHKNRMHLKEARYLGLMHLRSKNIESFMTLNEAIGLLDMMFMFDDAATYQGALGLAHHLQWVDLELKLNFARRLMAALFAKPDAPSQFATKIGWQDCLARLLVKKQLVPDLDHSSVSVDESVSISASEDAAESMPLSPTHFIEMAAKTYLPENAGNAVERIGKVVETTRRKVSDARGLAQEGVARTQQTILGKVQDLSEKATFRMRSATLSSLPASEPETPKYQRNEHLTFTLDDFAMGETKSTSTSSEDISSRGDLGRRTSSPGRTCDTDFEISEMEMVASDDEISRDLASMSVDEREEELCQLVVNALFTIMWRGSKTAAINDDVIKERGQVIACINMLGLNNDLYRSHVELKRHLVELCVQGVLSDLRVDGPTSMTSSSQAEHVMRWVYDLVVLDRHGNFAKKVSESLLDGILNLLECLYVFQEGQQDLEWLDMSKMAFDILLECMEHTECAEICAMASAKLHALVQTRMASTKEENAYLIFRLAKLIQKSLAKSDLQGDALDHFAYLAPVMRALLEKSRDQLNLTVQLPSLNLRHQSGPSFMEQFRQYQACEEWSYFNEKKVAPMKDAYFQGYLSSLSSEMDTFWAECFELSKVASHKRNREVGESKLKFYSMYLEPYIATMKTENGRYNYMISQQKSHLNFCLKRWRMAKRIFIGSRGVWANPLELDDHWKLSSNENHQRMRLKLIPSASFDPHDDASAQRDNIAVKKSTTTNSQQIFQMQISKEALQNDDSNDEGLTEEDLKDIAVLQMETAEETTEVDKASERLLFTEECQLITYMSVVKGKLEVSSRYVYFFDTSPYKETEDRRDFRWSLSQLREIHLRRFNLRRTGIEFFLVDQTNYLLNFKTIRIRNKVYSKFLALKLPNIIYSSGRTPTDALKASGLTLKWVNRDISNFEYLMGLNTIAGRTFNDLSQYPVFPWILADYTSNQLDLTNSKTFRDLSKPIGVQNPKHVAEVKNKFEQFEDPSGTVAKFHYGTHYSNSAMVLHYLVRVEPFTSLHIDLQSGRFDVADRQFHSIPQTWKNLFSNVNDVKELIPEFYYFPEFLINCNNFDLGHLQGPIL